MALINILSDFLFRADYDSLSSLTISHTKLHIIDFLAVSLYGFKNGLHKPFLNTQRPYSSFLLASIIGEGIKIPWSWAALVNSSMCPADLTDGSRFAALHPSSVVIPAALAAYEANPGKIKLNGKSLILAIALGYEIMIRIGRAMNPGAVNRGFHLTSIVGPLGSAATVSKILGFSPDKIADSLSIAALLGAGFLSSFKAPEPYVEIQVARACEAGIFSTLLAREGIRGNREILEEAFIPGHCDGFSKELITEELGKDFMIAYTYIKIHAGCRHIHAPIDAALMIVRQNKIQWRDIKEIRVKTYSVARDLEIEKPKTGDEAKFNMPFGIALALIKGNTQYDQFNEQNLKDPQIKKLMEKVTIEISPELDKNYPAKRGTVVEMETYDGKTFSQALDVARGEPESPLSTKEVEEKFINSASGLIAPIFIEKVLEFINSLDAKIDINELFDNLSVHAKQ